MEYFAYVYTKGIYYKSFLFFFEISRIYLCFALGDDSDFIHRYSTATLYATIISSETMSIHRE